MAYHNLLDEANYNYFTKQVIWLQFQELVDRDMQIIEFRKKLQHEAANSELVWQLTFNEN